MAIITVDSDLLSSAPLGRRNNPANRAGGALDFNRFVRPALVEAASIGSTIRICALPANGRYLSHLSKVRFTAGGAGALLGFGYEAYRGQVGEAVPASPLFFGSALNVAAAGLAFLDALTTPLDEWDIPTEVVMTATVAGAELPIGFVLSGLIVFGAAFTGLP